MARVRRCRECGCVKRGPLFDGECFNCWEHDLNRHPSSAHCPRCAAEALESMLQIVVWHFWRLIRRFFWRLRWSR